MQGRHHGFEVRCPRVTPPPFAYLGDMKQNITRFIIVITTSKRWRAPNEIT